MKRRLLRSAIRIGVAVSVGGVLIVGFAYWRSRLDPEWYVPRRSAEEIDRDSRQLEDRLVTAKNDAAAIVAAEVRAARQAQRGARGNATGGTNPTPVAMPAATGDEMVLRIPPAELTAFVLKWSRINGWEDKYRNFVSDPTVSIADGRLVIAGMSKQLGSVLSLHLRPELAGAGPGKGGSGGGGPLWLTLRLDRVTVGRLPVPTSLVLSQAASGRPTLAADVARWGNDARVDSNALANSAMTLMLAGKVLLGAMDQVATPAVFALPADERRSLPVYLTGITVTDGVLTLRARPVPVAERKGLVPAK